MDRAQLFWKIDQEITPRQSAFSRYFHRWNQREFFSNSASKNGWVYKQDQEGNKSYDVEYEDKEDEMWNLLPQYFGLKDVD